MLVGLNGFTDDQRTTLRKLDILPVTFTELEANVINLQQYAASSLTSLIADTKPDIGYNSSRYIEPELTFNSADGRTERIGARDWISAFLSNRDPIVYALLGNLGTGKTSFLKDLHQRCCRAYLDNPDYMPVSIFVPLGAFKQHSGDIQQMLLSIFRQHNVHNFPSAYIAHAIPERQIILLLDGLDEIHPIQNVDDILSTIVNLFDQLGQGCIAILSFRRELFLSTHEEMAYFGSYTGPRLADLQSRLAKKLSGQPNTKIIFLEPFDENGVKNYLLRRL